MKKGFTIIELVVVLCIIAILVALGTMGFKGHTKEVHRSEYLNNIKVLENASEQYYLAKGVWPRLTDEHYTSEQIESFAQEIKDKTGDYITIDTTGKYYPIDYGKLQKYVQKPKDNVQYIIQNPVGEIYYLDNLTEEGSLNLASYKEEPLIKNNKPVAVINMTPSEGLTTETNIIWDYTNSTDPDSDKIVKVEWQNKQDIYSTADTYIVKLRVQDEHGLWSNWVEREITISEKKLNSNIKLTKPLDGFTRYDDRHSYIKTIGSVTRNTYEPAYARTLSNFSGSTQMNFKFKGTAFKIICRTYIERTIDGTIEVDGIKYSGINMRTPGTDVMIVKFEMDNMSDAEHVVKIYVTPGATGDFMFDAVDIKGELIE